MWDATVYIYIYTYSTKGYCSKYDGQHFWHAHKYTGIQFYEVQREKIDGVLVNKSWFEMVENTT